MPSHSTYIWHQFYLHWRKVVFCLLLFSTYISFSQSKKSRVTQQEKYERNKPKKEINLPNYDEKLIHYGFFLGLNYDRVSIRHSQTYLEDTIYKKITPLGEAGFALGFLMNIRLHDQLAFKIVPSVGFYTRNIRYEFTKEDPLYTNPLQINQSTETSMIEMQFLMKYRSLRRKNTRAYVIAGIKPSIRAGGRRGNSGEQRMNYGRIDCSIEYGAGLEIYFPYFKWSPELRFSHGIVNVNTGDGLYNRALESIFTHTVSLYFFFE